MWKPWLVDDINLLLLWVTEGFFSGSVLQGKKFRQHPRKKQCGNLPQEEQTVGLRKRNLILKLKEKEREIRRKRQ